MGRSVTVENAERSNQSSIPPGRGGLATIAAPSYIASQCLSFFFATPRTGQRALLYFHRVSERGWARLRPKKRRKWRKRICACSRSEEPAMWRGRRRRRRRYDQRPPGVAKQTHVWLTPRTLLYSLTHRYLPCFMAPIHTRRYIGFATATIH